MILLDSTDAPSGESPEERAVVETLSRLPGIEVRVHKVRGARQTITEIYLIGDTARLSIDEVRAIPGVERVVRVSEEYRNLGRHKADRRATGFDYTASPSRRTA